MMSIMQARIRRERQRYQDHLRLVAGCIPFKFEKIVDGHPRNPHNRLLVLMIFSPNRDDHVFPKGGWENDETVEEATCREALEEAGVRGILGEKHKVRKKKKARKMKKEERAKRVNKKEKKRKKRKEIKRRIGRGCQGEGTLIGVTKAGGQFDCKAEMQFVPTAMVDLFKN